MYQWEMLKAHQLKKPTEDLSLKETEVSEHFIWWDFILLFLQDLPELKPLEKFSLPPSSFADLLMAVEFGHAFSGFLEIGAMSKLTSII